MDKTQKIKKRKLNSFPVRFLSCPHTPTPLHPQTHLSTSFSLSLYTTNIFLYTADSTHVHITYPNTHASTLTHMHEHQLTNLHDPQCPQSSRRHIQHSVLTHMRPLKLLLLHENCFSSSCLACVYLIPDGRRPKNRYKGVTSAPISRAMH